MNKITSILFSILSKRFGNAIIVVFLGFFLLLFPSTGKTQNNSLSFDGVDDYVNLGTLSPTGNFSTGFTFMGWVKWNAFNFYAPVFVFGDGVNNNDNTNQISISGYGTQNGIAVRCSNSTLLISGCTALNQWVHIAATVTETGRVTVYVNGSNVSCNNVNPISNVVRSSCTLGTSGKFNGSLDEISIWSRALTITEIQNKMNTSLAGNESGLYAYYKFNQGAPAGTNTGCITLIDAGVNAKNGTLTNFALTGATSNWLSSTTPVTTDNNALAFDGTNDFVNLGTVSPVGNFSTGFSYMGWVKWGAFNPWARLFDFGTGTGYNNIMLANNSTSGSLTLSNYLNTTPYQLTTGNILSLNQWVHIAATISNTGAAKIYVNGVVAASGNVSAPVNIARNLSYLGKSNWVSDGYLNASMDEVSFWTRALTADEINANMNSYLTGGETGLYAYYRFNQASANGTNTGLSTLFDATVSSKNGTLTNMSLSGTSSNWVSSIAPTSTQNNALYFDGTNDFVALPALGSNLTQFTIETWFNASNFTSTPFSGIFNTNGWSTGDVHFQITNATIQLAVCNSTAANVNYSFAPNTWYHLAATYNASTKRVNVYVNGSLIQNISLATAYNANFTAAEMGAFVTTRYFAGKLDEYRIWNTERSATDISSNMFKSFNGTESGLLAYFNFNEGIAAGANTSITSLNNAIGINHGTLNNFALSGATSNWVTGIKDRPNSHVTNFSGSVVSSKMTLKWSDVISGNSPDGYYIYASKTNSFTDPVNGTEPTIDNNLTDGTGVVKVLQGTQVYNGWINDELYIPYYFRIYPYTNSGVNTFYNTTATVPQVQITSAGQFSIQDGISFPSLKNSASAWGDYDNDGNLDLVITGDSSSVPITRIFKGNGAGGFAPRYQIKIQGVQSGSVAWGDYNNDGYLDLILTGSTTSAWPYTTFSRIYKNNKNGNFTEQVQIDIFPINNGSAAWGDFDNDGDLDILLAGSGVAKIYRNNGDNSFTDLISLIGVSNVAAAWGDYDKDGYLDVVYSGIGIESKTTVKLYRNNGNNTFSLRANTGLPNTLGVTVWGDYNNDGLLDLILGSYNGSKIYKNTGNGVFVEQTTLAAAGEGGSASWIDFDNDGFLDVLVCGRDQSYNGYVKLYRNTDGNTFSEVTPQSWPNIDVKATWADFDNDNRIDFFLGGYGNSFTGMYHNNIKTFNTAPPTPNSLSVSKQVRTGIFKWVYPKLAKPAKFNLRVGTSTGSSNVVTAQSLANGTRLIYNNATLIEDTSFTLSPFKVGTYFWSVQAVDINGKASSFAPEQTFTVDTIQSSNLVATNVNNTSIKLKWKRGNGDGCIVFCKANKSAASYPVNGVIYKHSSNFGEGSRIASTDWFCVYNGQADSVTVSDLNIGLTYTVHVMEYSTLNNSDKYFRTIVDDNIGYFSPSLYTDIQALTSVSIQYGSVEWGDYDNDGYLDILATGVLVSNQFYARVYHNNGDNTFTPLASFNLLLPDNAITRYNDRFLGKWADFDNDGYLDIMLVDAHNYGNAKILRNKTDISGTTFPEQINFGNDFSTGTCEDLDNDGYLDVVLTGANDTRIYKNNKDFTFTIQATIPFVTNNSSLSCGDFNNDGLSDILLTGYHKIAQYNFTGASKIYQNKGNFDFAEKTDISLDGICYGIGEWVDYDNDGFLDILLSGTKRYGDPSVTFLYHNDGNGNFTLIPNHGIASFTNSYADWGDYNNDGYLDLIIGGQNEGSFTKVYRNNKNGTFTEDTDFFIYGSYYGFAKWCDYDNDGDLDILFAGSSNFKIYQNTTTSIAGRYDINKKPSVPTNLTSVVAPNKITLSWSTVPNDETPSISMSYNLRYRIVGATNWNYAPNTNGAVRLLNSLGNVQMNKRIDLKNLPIGQYEWNVQAIDQGYLGSNWSVTGVFEVKNLQTFFTAETVCKGLPTHFYDQSVPADGIVSRKWDFKDGTTSTSKDPVHTFASSGTYDVKLVITNIGGLKDSLEKSVIVKPNPIVDFTVPAVCIGSATTVTNVHSIPNDASISWKWDFGDNLTSTVQQPDPHGYLNPGSYQVKLKATASNACSDSITKTAIVASIPIATLILDYGNPSFCKGDSVIYSTLSDPQYNYQWLRNDENINENSSILKVRTESGKYKVYISNKLASTCSTTSAEKTITVKDSPAMPVFSAESATTFCMGDSVKLNAGTIANVSYNWYRNDGLIVANQSYLYAKESGRYTLKTSFTNGCSSKSATPIEVTVNIKPSLPSVSYGETQLCKGSSITFSTQSNSNYTYKWKNGNAEIPGATSNLFTTGESGQYWLLLTNSNQCSVQTAPVTVTVNERPAKPIIVETNNKTEYCPGTVIELKVTEPLSNMIYQWKRSGIAINGANSETYKGKLMGGDYSLEARSGSCASESDILTLTTKPAPAKPNIYAWGPNVWIVICDNTTAKDYRWYYNDQLIVGAKTNQYVAKQELGNYNVEVNDGGECYTSSDIINIPTGGIISGVENLIDDIITVSPNPTSGLSTINLGNTLHGILNVEIFDALGKTFDRYQFKDPFNFSIDLTKAPKGIYFCKMYYKNSMIVKKIVKQ